MEGDEDEDIHGSMVMMNNPAVAVVENGAMYLKID